MGKATKQSTTKAKNKELKLRGLPRRPLSSFNMFFSLQRKKILDYQQLRTQDKNDNQAHVGFANLAKIIAHQWKNIDPNFKAELEVKAHQNRIRYQHEMRDWEMKLKMESGREAIEADLETTEMEMEIKSEIEDALIKIEAIVKEQMKQSSIKAKVLHMKDTFSDSEPKADDDVGTEMAVADLDITSPAADINEAIAFFKETRASPISRRHSFANGSIKAKVMQMKDTVSDSEPKMGKNFVLGVADLDQVSPVSDINEAFAFLKETLTSPRYIAESSYNSVRHRNMFDSSATSEQDDCCRSIVANTTTSHAPPCLNYMGNVDLGMKTPPPDELCSTRISHHSQMPTYPRLQFPSVAVARSKSMPYSPFGTSRIMSGNTGELSHWPPLWKLQKYCGVHPCSQRNAAPSQSRRQSSMY